jgi:hypothetical protein
VWIFLTSRSAAQEGTLPLGVTIDVDGLLLIICGETSQGPDDYPIARSIGFTSEWFESFPQLLSLKTKTVTRFLFCDANSWKNLRRKGGVRYVLFHCSESRVLSHLDVSAQITKPFLSYILVLPSINTVPLLVQFSGCSAVQCHRITLTFQRCVQHQYVFWNAGLLPRDYTPFRCWDR